MAQKLYCYVDESGQDTLGDLFVVSILVVAEERESLEEALEKIEQETGKRFQKWGKSDDTRRLAYIQRVLQIKTLRGKLTFAFYQETLDYLQLTSDALIETLKNNQVIDRKIIVLIDALPPTHARVVSAFLRQAKLPVKKVRGVRREENDALMRLADAMCGLVRDAYQGRIQMKELFERAQREGILHDIKKK